MNTFAVAAQNKGAPPASNIAPFLGGQGNPNFGGQGIQPLTTHKEYEEIKKPKDMKNANGSSLMDTLNDQSSISNKKHKTYEQACIELIQSNYHDKDMISQADFIKAQKALNAPTLEEVAARLWNSHDQHLERVEKLRQEVEAQRFEKGSPTGMHMDKECKFVPTVNPRQEGEGYRSLTKFISDQEDFLRQKNSKNEEKIREQDTSAIQNPKTCDVSKMIVDKKILEGKLEADVYTRLAKKKKYSPRKPTDDQSVKDAEDSVHTVNISMHRGGPISVALYDLNKTRIQHLEERKLAIERQEAQDLEKEVQKAQNPLTSQYLCQKFEREYRIVIANMASQESNWKETDPIPYSPFGSILTTMGFLPLEMSQESNDFKLLNEMWSLLEAEKTNGVSVENLLYLLLLIRGAKLPSREVAFQSDQSKELPVLRIGQIDENGDFIVQKNGQKRIFTHFKDLYVNRIQYESVHQKKSVKQVQVDIVPGLSKKTIKLAERHRHKIAGKHMALDIVTFLLTKNEVKSKEKEAKVNEISVRLQEADAKEFTFKPQTIEFEHKLDQYKNYTGDRNLDLNSKVQKGQYALRHNKDREEYEFDKNYQECTHKPIINQFDLDNPCVWRIEKEGEIKGIHKFMERSKAGREAREVRKAAQDDRFGLVKQTPTGQKTAVLKDEGQTTVSQASNKSKFKSAFGEVKPIKSKKPYVPVGLNRRKPVGYFESVKRNNTSMSTTHVDESVVEPEQNQLQEQSEQYVRSQQQVAQEEAPREVNENRQINDLQDEMEGEDEREPKLYVDVNVANFGLQRIIVYEGDTVDSLVTDFVKRCPIDEFMIEKLKTLLQQQIDGVLERIDEDESLSDQEDVEEEEKEKSQDNNDYGSQEEDQEYEEGEEDKSPGDADPEGDAQEEVQEDAQEDEAQEYNKMENLTDSNDVEVGVESDHENASIEVTEQAEQQSETPKREIHSVDPQQQESNEGVESPH